MQIRNVSLVSHSGAGKTSLCEALLFRTHARDRLGRIEDGNTASDHLETEKRRKISISTSVLPIIWQDTTINLLDTPGYADFVGEIRGAMRVSDSCLVVISAVSGVAVGTERVWETADNFGLPRIIAVNKMDRERADFFGTIASIRESLPGPTVAAAIPALNPTGDETRFDGVIDLLERTMYHYAFDGPIATTFKEMTIPNELVDLVEESRAQLVDAIVETNEALLERYLNDEALDVATLKTAFFEAVHGGLLYPVVPVSALSLVGLEPLLQLMRDGLRAPSERPPVLGQDGQTRAPTSEERMSARVWRVGMDPFVGKVAFIRLWSGTIRAGDTIHNAASDKEFKPAHLYTLQGHDLIEVDMLSAGLIGAITKVPDLHTGDTLCDPTAIIDFGPLELPEPVTSVALYTATRTDEDKLGPALGKLLEEDPTLHKRNDTETKEMLLEGMGHIHLEIAMERLSDLGVQVEARAPKIAYRETIRKTAMAQGKHKKQSGGHGQYGDCWLRLEPSESEFEFASEVVGGVIPTKYIPSVQKGVEEARMHGIKGYLVQNIRVVVYDGSYHEVDSSDVAFKLAAELAFRKALEAAGPTLLEPIMRLRVRIPERFTGEIMSDLQTRRARIQGIEPEGDLTVVVALVPLAELQTYSADLRSLTSGRGVYSLKFDSYAEVPAHLSAQIASEQEGRN